MYTVPGKCNGTNTLQFYTVATRCWIKFKYTYLKIKSCSIELKALLLKQKSVLNQYRDSIALDGTT